MGVTYERIILPVKLTAGVDKARGEDLCNIWLVKSHYSVTIVTEMKYSLHHNTTATKQWMAKWP